ncbi:MAG: class I SAM-dependent methyltransferase [Rhodospirillales bacterium]|nr:class I SAM-dependent methyltransferase [Alphaproteobacteria bacterium]MBL6948448.1 class I SAM-dependent methyltransferase [Rhodospirillales bacterium]
MAIIESLRYDPAPSRQPSTQTDTETGVEAAPVPIRPPVQVPHYLRDVYTWAYLDPRNVQLLDREWIVGVILWGQNHRLRDAALSDIEPGQKVLLPASVYGDLTPAMARHIGHTGKLDVIDVAQVQVDRCRKKLLPYPWASVRHGDARSPGGQYDTVCCFFLLHEVPDPEKHAIVNALLNSVRPGGKAVFVDYHKPHWAHPLKWLTAGVFRFLEPFAISLWKTKIQDYAAHPEGFSWQTETYFGGLYQKTVAKRP